MDFKILEEKENPLFNRKEIKIKINVETSPNYKETEEIIAKDFKVPADAVKIKTLKGKFGSRNFTASANVYKSKSDKDKIERKTKKETESEKKAQTEVKAE